MSPAPKRPAHRPPLPVGEAQTATIRERVRQDVRAAYEAIGGKRWLLEAIERAHGRLRRL